MNNKQNILFIAPAISMGGVERASVNTANGINKNGINVSFVCLFKKDHFFKLNKDIRLIEPSGFNVTRLSVIRTVFWLRSILRVEKNNSILVFGKFYGALVALALAGSKREYFLSERSSPLFKWKSPLNVINRIAFTLKPPKGVIAQTQIAAEYQKEYFKKSTVKVIPNSVRNVSLYPEIERQKVVLAVGRLNDHLKGFDLLFESFSLIKNKEWELHLAGGDEEGINLKILANNLGISHRIKFLGKIKDLDPYYAKAGLFVIPSRSEGFPNALAEAMAAGCCCVAFDFIAGPRDIIINGKNGSIVPNGDTHALANELDNLILDSHKRQYLGENALIIRQKLELSRIVEKIKLFIESGS